MYALLTCCGLATEAIDNAFKDMLKTEPSKARAVVIPNAVFTAEGVEALSQSLNELYKFGIERQNIFIYDLHGNLYSDYDVMYFCDGDPEHLLMAIDDADFRDRILGFKGIIVGVGAGSMIFADDMPENLGVLNCELELHCKEKKRSTAGIFEKDRTEKISLSDNQAVMIKKKEFSIIE